MTKILIYSPRIRLYWGRPFHWGGGMSREVIEVFAGPIFLAIALRRGSK